ncbi:hypothetical protein AB0H83_44930 [Dactylosporangium sp. NPDC050688]|uniref:hypothetical protein n=1 Tax=Dactylosporangium sp. NPDC050688 TaxID=3157217 RepID=UPI00340E911A
MDVADGTIQIQRHPGRRAPVDTRDTLTLPAAARQLCGISSGDQIVLTADLTHNRMTIYPMAIVARLLTEHHPRPTDDRRGR